MTCLGCSLVETTSVVLADGTTVCAMCPQFKAEHEARQREAVMVLGISTTAGRREYINEVHRTRGHLASYRLSTDVLALWDERQAKE